MWVYPALKRWAKLVRPLRGLYFSLATFPALKRWAKLVRPSGASIPTDNEDCRECQHG